MDLLVVENRPETCLNVGLDCGTCMRKAASSVAAICEGLSSQGLIRIFFEMYPSQACHPMAPVFESSYREATTCECEPVLASAAAA